MKPPGSPFQMTEMHWRGIILALCAGVIVLTLWCLTHGITTVFMHLYYFPIVLLAYHYRWKGCVLATLLALVYFGLVVVFDPGQTDVMIGALYRCLVFVGIAAVIAWLSERLVQVQDNLGKMQQFQESVIANANVWISVLVPNGTVLVWNEAAEEISGYKKSDVVGKNTIWKQLYPDTAYRKKVTGEIRQIIARDSILENFETEIRCADGATKTIVWNTRGMRDAGGKITGYIAIGRDITAQKTAEDTLRRSGEEWQTTFDAITDVVFLLDDKGRIVRHNRAFETFIKKPAREIDGRFCYEVLHGTTRAIAECPNVRAKTSRHHESTELKIGERWFVSAIDPILSGNGAVSGAVHLLIDITERKRAEAAIAGSEEKYRVLFTHMNAGSALHELVYDGSGFPVDYRILDVNPAFGRILGLKREDVIGKTSREVYRVDAPPFLDTYARVVSSGIPEEFEVYFSPLKKHFSISVYSPGAGRFATIFEDITERKRTEKLLLENQEQLATAMDMARIANWEFDVPTGIFTFNDRFYAMYGTTAEREGGYRMPAEVYAREFVHPEDAGMVVEEVRKAIETTDPLFTSQVEHRIIRRDGAVRYIVVRHAVTKDAEGRTIKTHGANQDITEQKAIQDRMQELLRLQEEQVRIINTSPAIAFLWRAEENWPVETVSSNISHFGYNVDDFVSGRVVYSSIIHPDDLGQVAAEVESNSRNHIDDFRQIYRIIGKDGSEYWIDDFTHIRRDNAGTITHYEGLILDITHRRQVEDALALEKQRMESLLKLSLMGLKPGPEIIAEAVEDAIRLTGSTIGYLATLNEDESVMTMQYWSKSAHESCKIIDKPIVYTVEKTGLWGEAVRQRKPIVTNDYAAGSPYKHGTPGGHVPLVRHMNIPVFEGDHIVAVAGVGNKSVDYDEGDVRQLQLLMQGWWQVAVRKRAEEAITRSEERYRTLAEASPDQIFINDRNGTILYANTMGLKLFGLPYDQVVGKQRKDLFPPDLLMDQDTSLEEVFVSGEPVRREARIRFGEQEQWIDTNLVPLKDTAGQVTAVLGVARDITGRKQMEEALSESRQLFSDIISFLPDPTFVIDKDGTVLAWNRALELLSGVSAEDIIGKGNHEYSIWLYGKRRPILIDLVLHPDMDGARMDYTGIRWVRRTVTAQTEITRPGVEHKITLSLVASPLIDPQGKITGAIESMRDISRLKEAEEELARFNTNLEKIIRERTQELHDEIVQRKNAEQEVQAALKYNRSVIEANPDLMAVLDRKGTILDVNAVGESLTGIPREQLIGSPYSLYLTDNSTPRDIFAQLLEKGRVEYTVQLRRADGHITPLSVNTTLFRGKDTTDTRIIVAAHDITRQKNDEAVIRAALDEQVLLLREVHHRVNNNLQIIISLTNLQMRQTDDPGVKQILSEMQNRVRAMSLVHEKLYRSLSLSHIDFADYTRFLTTQLFSFYGMDTRKVAMEFSLGKIMVDIVIAVPLGLLMNELISNALRHAFPQGRQGTISISGEDNGSLITLVIRDNGIGIPEDFDWKNTRSLGMRLIISLVDQVDGTITLDRQNGTAFTLLVKRPPSSGGKE